MSDWRKQAAEKLNREISNVKGLKETAMKQPVKDALLSFCEQDEEFAQAVAQGGSFPDCMKAVANGIGHSITDLEAYRRAVAFYFPGADIQMTMRVNLCASVNPDGNDGQEMSCPPSKGIMLNLSDFL